MGMAHTFIAYIDESGDDGLSGNYRGAGRSGGSSHWLGIGAVVWRASRDLDAVEWAKSIGNKLSNQRKRQTLHFLNLNHVQRIMAVNELAGKPMRVVAVVSNKKSIPLGTYNHKNQLYHYISRYLIERISWLCRDMRRHAPEGNGKVRIVFSRRGGMSDCDFKDYLRRLKESNDADVKIHWPVIDIDGIQSFDQANRRGLQIADIAISSICSALEPDLYGNCEPRFIKSIKQNIYNRKENYLSYGAKILIRPDLEPEYPQLREFFEVFKQ